MFKIVIMMVFILIIIGIVALSVYLLVSDFRRRAAEREERVIHYRDSMKAPGEN